MWDAVTTVSAKRRAPTTKRHFNGLAQIYARSLALSTLIFEQQVKNLINEMDKTIGFDDVILIQNKLSNFFDYVWD